MRRVTKLGVLSAGVVAIVGVSTAPAQASATLPTDQIAMTGTYTGVLSPGGATVVFECTATAPGAIATVITECHMTTGGPNEAIALPGSAAATAGTASIPLTPTNLCWRGFAVFLDTTVKPTSGCAINGGGVASLLGGAGVSN